jgi:predicted MFS family arabinose efflux permease
MLTPVTVAGTIFIIGAAIQAATQNKEMMMAGRFIAGIGIGQMVSGQRPRHQTHARPRS